MSEAKNEKFIVRVVRKREIPAYDKDGIKHPKTEQVDQIYEQEFDNLNIGEFACGLNRKEGKEKDEKSLKLGEGNKIIGERDGIPPLRSEKN